MATVTVNQGKTSFVKQFLSEHPEGNTRTVNEAWRAAGFDGTISPTLVNKTRVKLTGKRRRKARTARPGEGSRDQAQGSTRNPRQNELRQGIPQ